MSASDPLDVPLEDAELLEEVELISTLMVAAGETDEQLDRTQIDTLLGVTEERPAQHDGAPAAD